jgi:hypothetical protein
MSSDDDGSKCRSFISEVSSARRGKPARGDSSAGRKPSSRHGHSQFGRSRLLAASVVGQCILGTGSNRFVGPDGEPRLIF